MTQSAELATPMSFQDRLKERLRDSIGELLSDDDLTALVERGIDEVFFQPRYVRRPGSYSSQELPPLIHEVVKEVLSVQMREAVERWLLAHEDEVKQALGDCVKEGAGLALLRGMNSFFAESMTRMQYDVANKLSQH